MEPHQRGRPDAPAAPLSAQITVAGAAGKCHWTLTCGDPRP
ncbi:hypothetical protein ACEWX3_01685 [Mycobacterium sp. G7A2]